MGIYDIYETDNELETTGIRLDFGDFAVFVKRANDKVNKKFGNLYRQKMRPHRRALAAGSLNNEIEEAIQMEVFAKTVVIDWENVTDRDGEPIEFSPENCLKLFQDLPDFFTALALESANLENFKKDEMDFDAKN